MDQLKDKFPGIIGLKYRNPITGHWNV